ncbi:hypothetical protein SDC9_203982 [bioreactor metagenome]|uniref:Uncharacterized protein n=1 Tax=bioreactor metagenome TaxID=1076179 RepID=A0A645IYM5_9ZZZZ
MLSLGPALVLFHRCIARAGINAQLDLLIHGGDQGDGVIRRSAFLALFQLDIDRFSGSNGLGFFDGLTQADLHGTCQGQPFGSRLGQCRSRTQSTQAQGCR